MPPDQQAARPIPQKVSERINLLRFFLICGIVYYHMPAPDAAAAGGQLMAHLRGVFADTLFISSVPALTVISGYLLFSTGLHKDFPRLLRKKIRTLFVPMLLANLPMLLAIYLVQRFQLVGHEFRISAWPFDLWTWVNGLFAITDQPANYPLNFLRDLFLLSLAAPLFGLALNRAPWLGLAAISLFFMLNFDGPVIIRDTMPVLFYLGAMIAHQRWNLERLDPYWAPAFIILIIFSAIAYLQGIHSDMHWGDMQWGNMRWGDTRWFRLVSPFLWWPVSAFLIKTAMGRFFVNRAPYSFAIFILHAPFLLIAWFFYESFLPASAYPIFWALGPLAVIMVTMVFRDMLKRIIPQLATPLFGGR